MQTRQEVGDFVPSASDILPGDLLVMGERWSADLLGKVPRSAGAGRRKGDSGLNLAIAKHSGS